MTETPTQHHPNTASVNATEKWVKFNLCPKSISSATVDHTTSTDTPLCFTDAPLNGRQGKNVTEKIKTHLNQTNVRVHNHPAYMALHNPHVGLPHPAANPGETATHSPGKGLQSCTTTPNTHLQPPHTLALASSHPSLWPRDARWLGLTRNVTAWK